ncbi:MAG: carboxypeptidase-like regulatory domain-containing protein, partial [Acidobacteriota bacterium]
VPESLLPRFELSNRGTQISARREPWRVRVVGQGLGSWWVDVPPQTDSLTVTCFPAVGRKVTVNGGKPPETAANLALGPPQTLLAKENRWAIYAAENNLWSIPALPPQSAVAAVVSADDWSPAVFEATVEGLPADIRLSRGASIAGRVVNGEGAGLPDVIITATGWIKDGLPAEFALKTVTDDKGKWRIEHVPYLAQAALTFASEGFASVQRNFAVITENINAGETTLTLGGTLNVLVKGTDGRPVEGATVERRGESRPFVSSDSGWAIVRGLPSAVRVRLFIGADGFISQYLDVDSPLPKQIEVVLRGALTIRGTFLREDSLPVQSPKGLLRVVNNERTLSLEPDGSFVVQVEPDVSAQLVLSGSNVQQVVVPIEPGRERETRNLGIVPGPIGRTIEGRILNASDDTPLQGVRVWSTHPSATGELLPWIRGQIVETRTGADGLFSLSGVEGSNCRLRFEAPGKAPVRRDVVVNADSPVTVLDTVRMEEGAAVIVRSDDRDAGEAQVHQGEEWNDIDTLTVTMSAGEARFEHVSAGPAVATTGSSGRVECQKNFVVPPSGIKIVRCDEKPPEIRGVVLVGNTPAGEGVLVFSSPGGDGGVIMNRTSGSGIRQQRTYGTGPPAVTVSADGDGRFSTTALRSGRWDASWFPAAGGSAPSTVVDVPAEPSAVIFVRVESSLLAGRVLDGEGNPAAGARVTDRATRTVVMTGPDGAFRFSGLPWGLREVRAATPRLASASLSVELRPDQPTPPVTLMLDEKLREEQEVKVVGPEGKPAPGAFVFLETSSGEGRLLTTDTTGVAVAVFPSGLSGSLRASAFGNGSWVFGTWRAVPEQSLVIEIPASSSLEIRSSRLAAIEITTENGWALRPLFVRLGIGLTVSPEAPLLVSGLPPGNFTVTAEGTSYEVSIMRGAPTVLRLAGAK